MAKAVDAPQELTGPSAGAGASGAFGRRRFPLGKASGMAASDKDLFLSFGSGWSLRAKDVIVRFDRDLAGPRRIAEGMNGCCQRLDLAARDGVLYVAENTRYRVVRMDRDGKVLGTWGQRDRADVKGFGSCCNPMNVCFGPQGELLTSESGVLRIKRYSVKGELLGLVGQYNGASGCKHVAVGVSKDGSKVYVIDVGLSTIRVPGRSG